jgi:hypothetical protein
VPHSPRRDRHTRAVLLCTPYKLLFRLALSKAYIKSLAELNIGALSLDVASFSHIEPRVVRSDLNSPIWAETYAVFQFDAEWIRTGGAIVICVALLCIGISIPSKMTQYISSDHCEVVEGEWHKGKKSENYMGSSSPK